jgi:hypothetical protein
MPESNNNKNIKRKKTKNILAIPALAAAIPVNPKTPAMIDIIKNISAQYNIQSLLLLLKSL